MDTFQKALYPRPYGNIFKTMGLTDKFLIDGDFLRGRNHYRYIGWLWLLLLIFLFTARKKQ
jgi:hypothetical protein